MQCAVRCRGLVEGGALGWMVEQIMLGAAESGVKVLLRVIVNWPSLIPQV